jgi:ankyrin repeat protein
MAIRAGSSEDCPLSALERSDPQKLPDIKKSTQEYEQFVENQQKNNTTTTTTAISHNNSEENENLADKKLHENSFYNDFAYTLNEKNTSDTFFLQSCFQGNFSAVLNYVTIEKKNPYIVDKQGRTALFYAIWGNHTAIIQFLMRTACGIQIILSEDKTSSLQVAIAFGTPEIVEEILVVFPRDFTDSQKIAKRTLELLLHSQNTLLSPEVMANRRADMKILQLIKNFKEKVKNMDNHI